MFNKIHFNQLPQSSSQKQGKHIASETIPNSTGNGQSMPSSQPSTPQQSSDSIPLPSPQPEPKPNNDSFSVDDFLAGATTERKQSADTIVDAATGETTQTGYIEQAPAMSEDDAMKETRKLMNMRESGQALGLCYIAEGKLDNNARYKYEPWAKDLLIEAWAPIIQESNLRVNKWIQIIYAEAMGTSPLFFMAFQTKKLRVENDRLREEIMQRNANDAARAAGGYTQPFPANANAVWNRLNYDSEKKWGVDDQGYFIEGKNGFIKVADRKEKPQLTPDVYALLCKWNEKAKIDRIFEIN